ncbi:MAG: HD domain-containing protein [Candidatus Moranbacteria bacterium]|nr:HD domain-containing protein [Candidatus Moranbacteria bacterium]
MNIKKIVNFIFEINQLKRQRHMGPQFAGVKNPDTVAEHALRASQIGYILAVMEEANPEKVVSMLIIHDNGETRVGDQTKVGARYFSNKKSEQDAFFEQSDNLGDKIAKKWKELFLEYEDRTSMEGIIAKDADWLEQAFQAKEYVELGYQGMQNWIDNVEKALETESAKKILEEMKNSSFTDWWQGIKKMTYKKIVK